MATYYIGADVHSNNKELAVENRHNIVARYSVPTTIPAISTVLNSLQGKKIRLIPYSVVRNVTNKDPPKRPNL